MLTFTFAISYLTTFNLPNISGSYVILLFLALDFTSITSHIHNWVLFLLSLRLFFLFGVISALISSSILGTYWPGEFLFQYPVILPFHTVHGVLKARILKSFAIPFSSGPHSVQTLSWPIRLWGFPGGSNGKESSCNAGNSGLIPGLESCIGEWNGNPLQYFCLNNSIVRGAWQAAVHGVVNRLTWLSDFHFLLYRWIKFMSRKRIA